MQWSMSMPLLLGHVLCVSRYARTKQMPMPYPFRSVSIFMQLEVAIVHAMSFLFRCQVYASTYGHVNFLSFPGPFPCFLVPVSGLCPCFPVPVVRYMFTFSSTSGPEHLHVFQFQWQAPCPCFPVPVVRSMSMFSVPVARSTSIVSSTNGQPHVQMVHVFQYQWPGPLP